MACLVVALGNELEADIGRERRSTTVESMSLEQQYEQLGNIKEAFAAPPNDSNMPCCSNTPTFFVDLIEDDCNPLCIPEASDLSTECSEHSNLEELDATCELVPGSGVEVHVDIDEEDDDIYVSLLKQEPRVQKDTGITTHTDMRANPSIRRQRTYVDIDEDDDDVFFSIHPCETQAQGDAANICQASASIPVHLPKLPPSNVVDNRCETHAEEDAASVCEESMSEFVSVPSNAPSINAVESQPLDEVAQSCTHVMPEQRRRSMDFGNAPVSQSDASASVQLRPVVSNCNEQPPTPSGIAPGLLANLKSGRAQGVRKHLARKMTPEAFDLDCQSATSCRF